MKKVEALIKVRHGLKLWIHESGEEPPIGIIIDLYRGDKYLNETFTIFYDDFEEDEND